jgi:hypothetical protein
MGVTMRRITIVFVLGVLLVSLPALAAIDRPVISARLGFNVADLRGDDINELSFDGSDNLDTRIGLVCGGYLEYPLKRPGLSIMAGLLYSAKGGFETVTYCEGDFCLPLDISWRFNYLEVPLAVKMRFPVGPFEPYAFAGPAFAVRLGSELEVDFRLGHDIVKLEEVKSFDTGLILGGGVAMPLGGFEVSVEGQYNYGLMGIGPMRMENTPPEVPAFGENVKHGVLSFTLGFGLQI